MEARSGTNRSEAALAAKLPSQRSCHEAGMCDRSVTRSFIGRYRGDGTVLPVTSVRVPVASQLP